MNFFLVIVWNLRAKSSLADFTRPCSPGFSWSEEGIVCVVVVPNVQIYRSEVDQP